MSGFPPSLFAGSRFAVMGLGRNGLPAARALAAMGAEVVAWDDNHTAPLLPAPFQVQDLTALPFDFDALILSPGIPHALPAPHPVAARARAAGIPILSDAELLFQAVRRVGSTARFVGITGTNGKSTTTALLAHILARAGRRVAAGGNLGPAALALPLLPGDGIYVLEMSSYMLERLATLRFDAAAMLNISPDHLDRHGDFETYAAVKRAIFNRQTSHDLAVIGIDDAESRHIADWLRVRPAGVLTISGNPAADPADLWCQSGVLRDSHGPILPLAEAAALPGAHNAQNAAAASAIAFTLGLTREHIANGLRSFPGLPHRQQRIACIDGITFVNDSKATNAHAAARALGCYDRLIWIVGGQAKQGGIESLAPYFPRVAHALLIGRDASSLAATLARAGVSNEIAGTLDAAVHAAYSAARRAGVPVVLLSPACASFDQFSGFEARGDRFAALVCALPGAKAA
jgi:UDP-N-acetylmuramoylalanine--D-glutamate ligase